MHGHEVELGEPIDEMCTGAGGKAGALQITACLRQIVGVLGTSCAGAAVTAAPLLSSAGLVMISPSNTSLDLTSDLEGNASPAFCPGYFCTSSNALYEAQTVADFAADDDGAPPDGIFFPLLEREGSPFAEQARAFPGLEVVTLITDSGLLTAGFLSTPQSLCIY